MPPGHGAESRDCTAPHPTPRRRPAAPTTESDIVAPAIAVSDRLPFMPQTPMAEPTLRRLAGLRPSTIAPMHGPTFKGDGQAALNGLADHYGTL
ncbi:MAG: hypothetical protein K2Y40_05685 [Reyranella sp.]|nr:hypothetical protein [Reyranella sp.]